MQQCLWCPSVLHMYHITFFFQSFPNSPFPLLSCSKLQTSITTTFPQILAHVILSCVNTLLLFSFYIPYSLSLFNRPISTNILESSSSITSSTKLFLTFSLAPRASCAYFQHSKYPSTIHWVLVYLWICATITTTNFRPYCSPQKEIPYALAIIPPILPFHPLPSALRSH